MSATRQHSPEITGGSRNIQRSAFDLNQTPMTLIAEARVFNKALRGNAVARIYLWARHRIVAGNTGVTR
jgi:hypothetical protein